MSTVLIVGGEDSLSKGAIAYSADGTTWNDSSTSATYFGASSVFGVTYGNGLWVAGSNTGVIGWSTNGDTWNSTGTKLFSQCNAIDYGNGMFVAGGFSTGSPFAYSSDGKSWTQTSTSSTFFGTGGGVYGIKYANGYWVAIAGQGTSTRRIAYSTDGTSWTLSTATVLSTTGIGIGYGNNRWVAVGYGGNYIAYASHPPSGTWTNIATAPAGWSGGRCVFHNGTRFVAGGAASGAMYTSTDGITWSSFGTLESSKIYPGGITFYNGAWYVATGSGGGVQKTTDGSTWTTTTASLMNPGGGPRFIAAIKMDVPSPPVISYANVFSNGSAIVSFSQTSATPAVTNYFYSTNGGTSFTNIAQTTSPIVITGLNVNTSYALRLMARNTSGNSTMANVTVGTAPVITSIIPKNLALTVNFTPSSGATATNYLYSIDGGSTFVNSVATTTSPLQITGLTAGQSYSVAIKAAGTNWVSSNSSVTASTQPYNFGTTPVITGIVPGANSLAVSFNVSTGAYDTPTYYYSTAGNVANQYFVLPAPSAGTSNTFVINNLPGTSQSVVVLAINGAGNLYSTAVSQTPYYLGTRPNITRIQSNANALNVAFTGSQNANPTPYYYYSVNGSVSANTGLNATGNIVIPGLTTYGNYAVQIVAVSAAGNLSSNIAYGLPFVLGSTFNVNNSGLAMNYQFNKDLLDYATGTGVNAYNVSGTVSYVAGTGANTILGNGGAFFGNTNLAGFQPVQNITVGTNGATAVTWLKLTNTTPTLHKYTRIFEFVNSVTGLPFFSLQFDRTFTNIAVAFESGIVFSCPFVADTNWHHYSVIIDSTGNFNIYVDNVSRGTGTYANYSATFVNQINSCYVGGTNAGLSVSLN